MRRKNDRFTFNSFARKTDTLISDPKGRNYMSAHLVGNMAYILSSTGDARLFMRLSKFDISHVGSNFVVETGIENYSTFWDPMTNKTLVEPLNIRDIVTFTKRSSLRSDDGIPEQDMYIIATCYNNGLLLMKNNITWEATTKVTRSEDNIYIKLSFLMDVKEVGRIFTEKDYRLDKEDFVIYVSSPSPPVVYEIVINDILNVNIKKIYDIEGSSKLKYIGQDMITVNRRYVAFLIYSYADMRQMVRILSRNETLGSLGHVDIPLHGFTQPISSINFMGYMN